MDGLLNFMLGFTIGIFFVVVVGGLMDVFK